MRNLLFPSRSVLSRSVKRHTQCLSLQTSEYATRLFIATSESRRYRTLGPGVWNHCRLVVMPWHARGAEQSGQTRSSSGWESHFWVKSSGSMSFSRHFFRPTPIVILDCCCEHVFKQKQTKFRINPKKILASLVKALKTLILCQTDHYFMNYEEKTVFKDHSHSISYVVKKRATEISWAIPLTCRRSVNGLNATKNYT
jgi:hypothetical protein